MTHADPPARHLPPFAKLAVDLGPLAVFFIANSKFGIRWATAAFMVAMVTAIGVSWFVERRVALLAWVTLGFVLVFGGLTVWLDSDLFIKVKVTVIESLIGVTLLGGLACGKLFAKSLLGFALALDDAGWRKFSVRFALFSLALAVANEAVWRNVTTDRWVTFKVIALPIASVLFMLAQMPLFKRHAPSDDKRDDERRST